MSNQPITMSSSDIKEIFPSTKTKTINKLITENSITRIINRLLDVEGYVISSEFPESVINSYIQSPNNNTYIPISNGIQNCDLEFSIRGYYFNLGKYSDLLSSINLSPGESLVANIYISNDTEYPELYGQDTVEQKSMTGTTGDIVFPGDVDTRFVDTTSIIVYAKNSQNEYVTISSYSDPSKFTINDSKKLCYNDLVLPYAETEDTGIQKVTYTYAVSTEALTLIKSDGSDDPSTMPMEDYKMYSLTLIKNYDGEVGIPIESLHKFDTISVASIDGGEIIPTTT